MPFWRLSGAVTAYSNEYHTDVPTPGEVPDEKTKHAALQPAKPKDLAGGILHTRTDDLTEGKQCGNIWETVLT